MPEGKKLGTHLSTLLETAETLNTASDSINTILQAVEQQLITANIGLEVWLEDFSRRVNESTNHRDEEGQLHTAWTELGFMKLYEGWHIVVREREAALDADGDECAAVLVVKPYPLAKASRMDRIAALRLLPDLIQAIQAEALRAIATIEEAKKLIAC